jgi:hypothetical protein
MWRYMMIGVLTLLPFADGAIAQKSATTAQATTDANIRRWIGELGSSNFRTRQRAAGQLLKVGRTVIKPLADAAEQRDLEVSLRSLQLLLQIAKGDDIKAGPIAARALDRLANSDNRLIASHATEVLDIYRHFFADTTIRQVLKFGGQIVVDVKGDEPIRVRQPTDLPNRAIVLRTIDLRNSKKLTDAALREFRRTPDVTEVLLSGTAVGDSGLAHLAGLTTLRTLYLERTSITGDGLQHVARLSQLQTLWLNGTGVGDDGLAHLAGMKQLVTLDLERTRVGDDGLKHLAELTELMSLNLRDTTVGDAGLASLSGLTKLQSLSLVGSKVTDAGLQHLKKLKNLEFVDLRNTAVTAAGAAALKSAFLDLYVRVTPPMSAGQP